MYVQCALLAIPPIRAVSETVNPNIFKLGILGQPFLRPEVLLVLGFAPSLPRATGKTMDKYQLNQRGGWFMEETNTNRSDSVVRVIERLAS